MLVYCQRIKIKKRSNNYKYLILIRLLMCNRKYIIKYIMSDKGQRPGLKCLISNSC
jgi:hypothetical protein